MYTLMAQTQNIASIVSADTTSDVTFLYKHKT